MTDVFAGLILRQVSSVVHLENNEDTCLNLLKIFHPELKFEDIKSKSARSKYFKEVKLRVHPDKHEENLKEEATKVFKKLSSFIDQSENLQFLEPLRKKAKTTNIRESNYPPSFHVEKKWQFLKNIRTAYHSPSSATICYCMRGQIIHHGFTERCIWIRYLPSLQDHFNSLTFVSKKDISEEIKREIMSSGPVVSRSYKSPKGRNDNDFPIIMGWELNDVQGEVWIMRIPSLDLTKDFYVAFDTCEIEVDIVIPTHDLSLCRWQQGVFLAINNFNEWSSGKASFAELTLDKFVSFWGELGVKKASELVQKSVEFEVYNGITMANSRRARVTDFERVDAAHVKIYFTFK